MQGIVVLSREYDVLWKNERGIIPDEPLYNTCLDKVIYQSSQSLEKLSWYAFCNCILYWQIISNDLKSKLCYFFFLSTGSCVYICAGNHDLVGLFKVFLGLLDIRLDGSATLLPASRADFTVLISELEGFNKTQDFIDATANRQIVDSNLSNHTFRRDDE